MGKMVISREEAAIECMKLSSPKPAEEEESFGSKRQKYKRIRREQLKRLIRDQLEKVPWKVPHDDDDHKKVKGNDGVFSSDYEHARTHPPSHN
uniref:Uncharacterized protein n=2 Tax=Cucumis sativus TaxID=3659 RepID=A0A0A0KA38_CUCSA